MAKANEAKDLPTEDNLLEKYQKHSQVFSKKGVQWLPFSRMEDMTINFKKEAPEELDYKIYILTKTKMEML